MRLIEPPTCSIRKAALIHIDLAENALEQSCSCLYPSSSRAFLSVASCSCACSFQSANHISCIHKRGCEPDVSVLSVWLLVQHLLTHLAFSEEELNSGHQRMLMNLKALRDGRESTFSYDVRPEPRMQGSLLRSHHRHVDEAFLPRRACDGRTKVQATV